ncbi:hypothetical protein AURDEDRAFT_147074 [Auricularia subglabra TFB-10046 SS5]|uniref:Zn(2)-C6 fungal-type domain-containing protein n=1 Tax=Auricularia subglabra (strain TFB-10046 / SS5) TaxID=717982 RepID=J0DAH9_AURST|nr:hypothetical protein AURDEDRAFT_147074 [Auricularia subglabra TFB-10046 SS5]
MSMASHDQSQIQQPTGAGANSGAGAKRNKYCRRVCAECSRRHCKCDGTQPTCAPCTTAKLNCEWPEKKRGPKLGDEVVELRGRVAHLESLVRYLLQAQHGHQQQQLSIAIPLTPASSGPPSPFPSSAESSPHPGTLGLPQTFAAQGQHGETLAVPSPQYAYQRHHVRTPSAMSSGSEGSFHFDLLGVPADARRHARTPSGASSSSEGGFQYDLYAASQSSSPSVPTFHLEPVPAPVWGPAPYAAGPPAAGHPNVMHAGTVTEPGRSGGQGMFNTWGGALQAGDAGLGLHVAERGSGWENVADDMDMGEATMDG